MSTPETHLHIQGLESSWRVECFPFSSVDGVECSLLHVIGSTPGTKGPLLMVHGAGVRAQIFCAPSGEHLIHYLVSRGWDIWLLNWRASIDIPFNTWTLEKAAVYDHPRAVQEVCLRTGASQIDALIHCQGSTSFTMSLLAGLVPQVRRVISNAVSLHPIVPSFSRFKLNYMQPLASLFIDRLNPRWGLYRKGFMPHLFNTVVRLFHQECENLVCKHVSFTYGTGWPALWSHENLNEATHEWLKEEFADVPFTFLKEIKQCVSAGRLMSYEEHPELPKDFTAQTPKTDARFALFAGENNLCFLPESQRKTFGFLSRYRKDHSLHVLPNYGHLDVFMGKHAARDVFPLIEKELETV